MHRTHLSVAVLVALVLASLGLAADSPPALVAAQGTIDKVEKDTLTIRPRGPDGKFEKSVVLKLTGTSRIATLAFQKRGNKVVAVQKDTEAKDLEPKQAIAVIYTAGPDGHILLTAVAQPDTSK